MAESKVNNVNIISNARSVGSIVIITENVKMIKLSDRNLSNIRHKVVRDSVRILADASALMCADRIEITEKCNTPVVIGSIKVLKNKLNHIFCCTVRIGRAADFHCFIERRRIVHSVNGSR